MVKIDFKPLEYIEVLQGKPLTLEPDGLFAFTVNLQSIENFLKFNATYKTLLTYIDSLKGSKDKQGMALKIQLFSKLIDLVADMAGCTRRQRKKMRRYYLANIDAFLDTFKIILEYNAKVKKKLEALQSFDIWGSDAFPTLGGISLSSFVRHTEKGEMYFVPRHSQN
jgi:hypothetical protein